MIGMLRSLGGRSHTSQTDSAPTPTIAAVIDSTTKVRLDGTRTDTRTELSNYSAASVNRIWCLEEAGNAVLKDQAERAAALNKAIEPGLMPKGYTPGVLQGVESSLLRGDKWLEKHTAVIVPFAPIRLSERLSIQQGHFLVPRDVDRSFMENLAALGDPGNAILKYVIPTTRRGRILERLRAMNMTRAQLFPGLDGYAQSFRQLLFAEPHEERLARLRRQAMLDGLKGALEK